MGSYLLVILLFAVLVVLVSGVVLMGIGGKANHRYGNKLMVARVILQGLVLLVVVLIYFFGNK